MAIGYHHSDMECGWFGSAELNSIIDSQGRVCASTLHFTKDTRRRGDEMVSIFMNIPLYPRFEVPYASQRFPRYMGPLFSGTNTLEATMGELLWAAISVGKAEESHLLRYGAHSILEVIYRSAMILSSLRVQNHRLIRTAAFDALDPSEKGAISYFFGLTMAKLFAYRLLDTPWLMHLDLYRNRHCFSTIPDRKTKPDLVGLNSKGQWIVMEAKGRSSGYSGALFRQAKLQTRHLRKIDGQFPALRVALASDVARGYLRVNWEDPNPRYYSIRMKKNDMYELYYKKYQTYFAQDPSRAKTIKKGALSFEFLAVPEADLGIGLPSFLLEGQWERIEALTSIRESCSEEGEGTTIGSDGLLVRLGPSWMASGLEERFPYAEE